MVDGGILDITEDNNYTAGCDTCDYNATYTNNFYIKMEHINLFIYAEGSGQYPLSQGHMMKVLLPNVDLIKGMTETEFAEWLKIELTKLVPTVRFNVYSV
jgi:hypothetical protein